MLLELLSSRPLFRVNLQAILYQVLNFLIQLLIDLQVVLSDLLEDLEAVFSLERQAVVEQTIREHPEGPDVS